MIVKYIDLNESMYNITLVAFSSKDEVDYKFQLNMQIYVV